jgi:predicted neuraminidase
MMAFWFAGTRESAADVNIVASRLDRATLTWSPAFTVVDRHEASLALGVRLRRLGNPVAWADAQGRLHLFVVGTGLGGWAASRVVHFQAPAQSLQDRWQPRRILPLMPLVPSLNTSVLVRTSPMPLKDGGALLPVYFELGMKYGAVVRLGPNGEMQALQRITQRHDVLQPALVPLAAGHWLAFQRNQGPTNQLAVSATTDAGAHWQDLSQAPFSNADSSVAALRTDRGVTVLLHNPAEHGRRVLWWSQTTTPTDAAAWQTQPVMEGAAGEEYSYPSLVELPATPAMGAPSELWLSYTHRRQAIAVERWQADCKDTR